MCLKRFAKRLFARMSFPVANRSSDQSSRASSCDVSRPTGRARRALTGGPPVRDRVGKIVPKRGRKIRNGDADAVSIGCGAVKPFRRGEIETEAAGMADRQARRGQVIAHGGGGPPRCRLIQRLRTAERDIKSVSEAPRSSLGAPRRNIGQRGGGCAGWRPSACW